MKIKNLIEIYLIKKNIEEILDNYDINESQQTNGRLYNYLLKLDPDLLSLYISKYNDEKLNNIILNEKTENLNKKKIKKNKNNIKELFITNNEINKINLEFNKKKNEEIDNIKRSELYFSSESDEKYNEENSGYTINYNQNTISSPKENKTNYLHNTKSSYENIFTHSNNSQSNFDEIAKKNIEDINLRNNLSYFKILIDKIKKYYNEVLLNIESRLGINVIETLKNNYINVEFVLLAIILISYKNLFNDSSFKDKKKNLESNESIKNKENFFTNENKEYNILPVCNDLLDITNQNYLNCMKFNKLESIYNNYYEYYKNNETEYKNNETEYKNNEIEYKNNENISKELDKNKKPEKIENLLNKMILNTMDILTEKFNINPDIKKNISNVKKLILNLIDKNNIKSKIDNMVDNTIGNNEEFKKYLNFIN